jgi:outer membrane protein TolC
VRELEEAVRGAQRGVLERLSAFDAATAAVGQAEENLRIRRQQFSAGRATSEDVLDAQALLTRQRAVAATALYEAHSRRAGLQQLMGAPMEELLVSGKSP